MLQYAAQSVSESQSSTAQRPTAALSLCTGSAQHSYALCCKGILWHYMCIHIMWSMQVRRGENVQQNMNDFLRCVYVSVLQATHGFTPKLPHAAASRLAQILTRWIWIACTLSTSPSASELAMMRPAAKQ
jgi:hypothetical protein